MRLSEIKKRREEYKLFCKLRENKLEEKVKREELLKKELEIAKQEFYSNLDEIENNENKDKEENESK